MRNYLEFSDPKIVYEEEDKGVKDGDDRAQPDRNPKEDIKCDRRTYDFL